LNPLIKTLGFLFLLAAWWLGRTVRRGFATGALRTRSAAVHRARNPVGFALTQTSRILGAAICLAAAYACLLGALHAHGL
jgi:hypothetical protein